jgi:DNA/RNA-binding domain of Phe-tRNA-synthetase-like protein
VKLAVSEEMHKLFPDLRIGVLVGHGLDNRGGSQVAAEFLAAEVADVRASLTTEALPDVPQIRAWQDAYERVGQQPKRNRPAAEALLRSVLRGKDVGSVSPIVDIYLGVQLFSRLPIGGYDLAGIDGGIALRRSMGGEVFQPIGPDRPSEVTSPGEVVYADESKVLTRRWNWRDCEGAKISGGTSDIVLMSEAPTGAVSSEALMGLITKLKGALAGACGGAFRAEMWDASKGPSLEVDG